MIAVKYIEGLAFNWPSKIKKPVSVLPSGYDILFASEEDFTQFLADNQVAYDAYKLAQEQAKALAGAANNFKLIREKWQEIADKYAAQNVATSITTAQAALVADKFDKVKYYLDTNVPMQAIAEMALVSPADPFLPQAKIDEMRGELLAYISEVFSLG